MINRDGGQWRLTWERTPEGRFRAWVVSRPDIFITGDVGQEMDEVAQALYDVIDERLHAGEWTADWTPPLPGRAEDRATVSQEYVTLVADGSCCYMTDPDLLFEGGICRGCGHPLGKRTGAPLDIYVETLGGLLLCCKGGPPFGVLIARKETVEAIGTDRLAGADVRPVRRIGRGRARFVEIVPPRGIPPVGLRNEEMFGVRCKLCGRASFSHRYKQAEYRDLFRASQIPNGSMSFWIASPGSSLCVRQDWWHAVRDSPPFRGVVSWPLWSVTDADADGSPVLREVEPPEDRYVRQLESQRWLREYYKLPEG